MNEIPIVLTERFYNELWPLNKVGSEEKTLIMLNWAINQNFAVGNQLVDFDLITKKYQEYLNHWNYNFATTEKENLRFVGKENQKKTIETFIREKKFMETFEIQRTPRDWYLFANESLETLNNLVTEWKRKIVIRKEKTV